MIVNLDWDALTLSITNPTPYPVYVMIGADSTPSAKNFSDLIAPYSAYNADPNGARDFNIVVDNSADLFTDFPFPVNIVFSTGGASSQYPLTGITIPGSASAYINKIRGVQTASLIDLWTLNDKTGPVAVDTIAAGRNGAYIGSPTLQSAAFADNVNFSPLFVSASSQYVNIPLTNFLSAWNNSEFTILIWIKMTLANWNSASPFACFELNIDNNNNVSISHDAANQITWNFNLNNTTIFTRKSAITDTAWISLVGTHSHSNLRMRGYYDGVQVGADQAEVQNLLGTPATVFIGAAHGGPVAFFPGNLAMCAIWTKELTAAEVAIISTAP